MTSTLSSRVQNPQRWIAFVNEYLKDFSPGGAYLRAFGAPKTGDKAECEKRGKKLIRENEWIRNKILEKSQGRITLADITPERVTLELARIAFADYRKLSTVSVTNAGIVEAPIPVPMLDDDTASAVRSVKFDVHGNRVVEFADKAGALKTLAQMLALNPAHRTMEQRASQDYKDHDSVTEDEILAMFDDEANRDPEDTIDAYDRFEEELEEVEISDDDE